MKSVIFAPQKHRIPLDRSGLKDSRPFWGLTDLLLGVLCVLYFISGTRGGEPVSVVAIEGAFPYVALYFCAKVLFRAGGRVAHAAVLCALCVWGAAESVKGLSQVFGHTPSGHSLFGMTGSFSNPGPYGGFVAVSCAVSLGYLVRHRAVWGLLCGAVLRSLLTVGWRRPLRSLYLRWVLMRLLPFCAAAVSAVLAVTVLPASMSRAGWLSLAVALAVCLLRETGAAEWMRRHRAVTAAGTVAAVLLCAGAFMLKRDSASGRLHIWHMEVRAIAAAPLRGTGPGTALGAYGRAQERYFREAERPASVVRVAGCPEYAFNEYLKVGMETGVPGLALCLAALASAVSGLVGRRSSFGYGLVAMSVFAFFSYPLSVWRTAAVAVVLLAAGGVPADRVRPAVPGQRVVPRRLRRAASAAVVLAVAAGLVAGEVSLKDRRRERREAVSAWEASRQWSGMGLYDEALEELSPLYPAMRWNFRYLYDYGYALHKEGRFEEGIAVLSEGARISSDPMFHNIIGKCHETLGRYDAARDEYMTAHYMVPCRLYPLVLLMRMYAGRGMDAEAVSVGRRILEMPVNPKSRAMQDLRREVSREMERLGGSGPGAEDQ